MIRMADIQLLVGKMGNTGGARRRFLIRFAVWLRAASAGKAAVWVRPGDRGQVSAIAVGFGSLDPAIVVHLWLAFLRPADFADARLEISL